MSNGTNPVTKAVSRPQGLSQTPASNKKKQGKVEPQSKTKIEYRAPLSALHERYLGSCEKPFTKTQYERLVRSPIMPPSFLSVRASEPKGGKVCLYASGVFGGVAVKGLIGKLKTSCTKVAGSGSEAACKELVSDLERRLPKKQATPKAPSLHDPRALNPFDGEFWKDRWRGGCGGFDFGIGMGVVAGGMWLIKKIIDKIGGGGNGDGTTGDPEGPSTPSTPDTGSKMVAATLGTLAGLMRDADDIDPIPFPPIVPAMDTIDTNYIVDPLNAAQAAYNGMTVVEWSAANTYSNAALADGIKKFLVGAGLFVGAVIATIFGPKMMPKGMMPQPQGAPAGFGGGGLTPGGGRGCGSLVGCTPNTI